MRRFRWLIVIRYLSDVERQQHRLQLKNIDNMSSTLVPLFMSFFNCLELGLEAYQTERYLFHPYLRREWFHVSGERYCVGDFVKYFGEDGKQVYVLSAIYSYIRYA